MGNFSDATSSRNFILGTEVYSMTQVTMRGNVSETRNTVVFIGSLIVN